MSIERNTTATTDQKLDVDKEHRNLFYGRERSVDGVLLISEPKLSTVTGMTSRVISQIFASQFNSRLTRRYRSTTDKQASPCGLLTKAITTVWCVVYPRARAPSFVNYHLRSSCRRQMRHHACQSTLAPK
jgi:hypothetical protein